ncbi:hypothetical protein FACS1894137_02780 [Spirochaetia bacterium]|nr:hypothetical protein FACS1894137_02780 [Spirochaetia bacterium]
MFVESTTQEDLFKSTAGMMEGKRRKAYEDKKAWHNQFREQVTNKIDETIFKPLYSADHGAPNAAIRVSIGMMILKTGQETSDEYLFEEARFNMLTRSALGLVNNDDEPPTESTYYLLRQKIVDYEKENGVNLFDKMFKELTKEQCLEFDVKGKSVRMDSKLLGSNIAWISRYGIVHETLRLFYGANEAAILEKLEPAEQEALKNIYKEESSSITYRSTKEELDKKFVELGALMYILVTMFKFMAGQREYHTMERVFEEQYKIEQVEGEKKTIAVPREKAEISAKSVQNPSDPDAQYRNKAGVGVKGYSINVTETCDKDSLNLIVDVETKGAGAPDNEYVQPSLEAAAEIVPDKIEVVHTDGAYHSPENRAACKENGIDLVTGGVQGKPSKYDLEFDKDDPAKLKVTNKETGEAIPTEPVKTRNPDGPKKWKAKDGESTRTFTEADVETCQTRKKMEELPKETRNIRNNVEASIFQLGYHFRGDKSKYRGLEKHEMWALSRCLWINFRRIAAWVVRTGGVSEAVQSVLAFLRYFFAVRLPDYLR